MLSGAIFQVKPQSFRCFHCNQEDLQPLNILHELVVHPSSPKDARDNINGEVVFHFYNFSGRRSSSVWCLLSLSAQLSLLLKGLLDNVCGELVLRCRMLLHSLSLEVKAVPATFSPNNVQPNAIGSEHR